MSFFGCICAKYTQFGITELRSMQTENPRFAQDITIPKRSCDCISFVESKLVEATGP